MLLSLLLIALLILLILLIAFFAASESAFLSLNRLHLKSKVRTRERGAKSALYLFERMDSLLSLVLIGTNFLDAAAASLSTALASNLGGGAVIAATLAMTVAITIFGEIVPKTFAISHADKVAFTVSPILIVLQRLLSPIVTLFSLTSRAASFLALHLFQEEENNITEADIKMMIDVGAAEGTVEKSERDMIYKIFTLDDITVRSFMRHRSLVVSISPNDAIDKVQEAFAAGYSHIPVIDGEDVIGVIKCTALLFYTASEGVEDTAISPSPALDVTDFVRRNMTEPLFVPETHTAATLLTRFKEEGEDFAVVLDEQGAFSGIVTMDCLERVVFARMVNDNLSPAPSAIERVKVISSTECVVPGDMRIEDVNELLGLRLLSDEYSTIGGYLLEKFGCLPSIGEVYIDGAIAFVVDDQARRRILSVRIKRFTPISRTPSSTLSAR